MKPVGRLGPQVPVVDGELDAERLEAAQVHVDLARADLAPARHGNARPSEPSDERTEHRDARPHLRDEFVGRLERIDRGRIDRDDVRVTVYMAVSHDMGAKPLEHFRHDFYIRNERHVAYHAFAVSKNRRRHELERGVLRPRYVDIACKNAVPLNDDHFI